MAKVPAFPKAFAGHWRIVEMDTWDNDFPGLVEEAHITFKGSSDGEIVFGALTGFLDVRFGARGRIGLRRILLARSRRKRRSPWPRLASARDDAFVGGHEHTHVADFHGRLFVGGVLGFVVAKAPSCAVDEEVGISLARNATAGARSPTWISLRPRDLVISCNCRMGSHAAIVRPPLRNHLCGRRVGRGYVSLGTRSWAEGPLRPLTSRVERPSGGIVALRPWPDVGRYCCGRVHSLPRGIMLRSRSCWVWGAQ